MKCRVTIHSELWGTHYVDVNQPSMLMGEKHVLSIIREESKIITNTGMPLYITTDEVSHLEGNMIL